MTLALVAATKTCSRCKEPKSLDSFCRDVHAKDGLHSSCRVCTADAARLKTAKRRSSGVCTQCYQPHAGPGVCCPECLEQRKQEYANRDRGQCWLCQKPGLITALYCEDCWLAEVSKRFLGPRKRGAELKDLFTRQGHRCALSGVPLQLGRNASLDHILPKSCGGADDVVNYRWVHTRVNQLRGNLTDGEFYDLCARVVGVLGADPLSCGRDATWLETYRNGIF